MDPKNFENFKNTGSFESKDVTQESSPETSQGNDVKQSDEKLDLSDKNDRKIPYSRFKEKVEEANTLKEQIESIKTEVTRQIEERDKQWKTYYEAEIAAMQRQNQNQEVYDDYTFDAPQTKYDDTIKQLQEQLQSVTGKLTKFEEVEQNRTLKSEMGRLKEIYPQAADEHVLAMKKLNPTWSLEKCAERSHQYFEDNIRSRYDAMMEAKKEAAKAPILREGRITIKPEERPKNMREAKALLEKMLGAN